MMSAYTLCASLVAIITMLHSGHTSAQAPNLLVAPSRLTIAAQPGSNFELPVYWSPAASPSALTIVALHGCGGLFDSRGRMQRRETAFIRRANDAGHHVLLVDSFTPRGEREICTTPVNRRSIRVVDRREDVLRVVRWLESGSHGIAGLRSSNGQAPGGRDASLRYIVLGWSNGASTVLETADPQRWPANLVRPLGLAAFYPGCRPYVRAWPAPLAPMRLYLGEADNWTPASECQRMVEALRSDSDVRFTLYPQANHGFDGPDGPQRERTELRTGRDGKPIRTGPEPMARERAYRELFEWLGEQARN